MSSHSSNFSCDHSDISKEFETQGFVGPIDVLTPSQAKDALDEVRNELHIDDPIDISNKTGIDKHNNNNGRFKLHLVLRTIDSIAHHPTIIDAVQRALQTEDILLWSSDVNLKPANSLGYFAPHQDSTYAGLSPASKCLTAWVALSDPVGENEGCLSFFPGSHVHGQIPHVRRSTDMEYDDCLQQDIDSTSCRNHYHNDNNNMLSLGQYIADDDLKGVTTAPPRSVPLRAGQMTLHSFLTVHHSGPNRSKTHDRVGLALRYVDGRNVVQEKPIKEMVTWISGTAAVKGRFDLEPRLPEWPDENDVRTGRLARQEAMRREEANYFDGTISNNGQYLGVTPGDIGLLTKRRLHIYPLPTQID